MVSQTHPVDTDIEQPMRSMARSTSSFADEVLALAELQTQLIVLESKDGARQLLKPVLLFFIGGLVALGLVPVAALAVAQQLVESLALSLPQALAVAFGLGVLLVAGLMLCGYWAYQALPTPFVRSSREWAANSRWLHSMVRRQGRRW
jgi:uncharacterized membrane protein YqjE